MTANNTSKPGAPRTRTRGRYVTLFRALDIETDGLARLLEGVERRAGFVPSYSVEVWEDGRWATGPGEARGWTNKRAAIRAARAARDVLGYTEGVRVTRESTVRKGSGPVWLSIPR